MLQADEPALLVDTDERRRKLMTGFRKMCNRRMWKVGMAKSKVKECSYCVGLTISLDGEW